MPTAKAVRSFGFQALMAFGALACILGFISEFFDIKSKDVHMHVGWPAWMWLICGLALFAISITSSVRSFRVSLSVRRITEQEKNKAIEELNAKHALDLNSKLEETSGEWDRKFKKCEEDKNKAVEELNRVNAKLPQHPSKLIIRSANYAAVNGKGKTCDVTKFMRQIIFGDCLVHDIESDNFQIGGENFVPKDPCFGEPKRLQVTYSYDGEPETTVERPEDSRIVLPQDSEREKLSAVLGLLDAVRDARPATEPPTAVTDNDPRIYVEIVDRRFSGDTLRPSDAKVVLSLINRGGSEATNIHIKDIQLRREDSI